MIREEKRRKTEKLKNAKFLSTQRELENLIKLIWSKTVILFVNQICNSQIYDNNTF